MMKKLILGMLIFLPYVAHAQDEGKEGDSLIVQNTPCKGVAESQKVVITAEDGQSIELECHHFLPQEQEVAPVK